MQHMHTHTYLFPRPLGVLLGKLLVFFLWIPRITSPMRGALILPTGPRHCGCYFTDYFTDYFTYYCGVFTVFL